MKLEILFWFYKEVDVCKNRLSLLKRYNPESKIFGLYGWPKSDEKIFKDELGEYLDDFYTIPEQNGFTKWIHWDLFLFDWYVSRGQNLVWESLVIAQWDLLAFESFSTIFSWIERNEMYLPHYGFINPLFEESWHWTSTKSFEKIDADHPEKPHMRENYLSFKSYVKNKYWYDTILPYCIFMLAVFPRVFFERYWLVENKELGFLEYKIPTYAKIFDIKLFEKDLWERAININSVEGLPMNAYPVEIEKRYIDSQLDDPNGWRIFHPYYQIY